MRALLVALAIVTTGSVPAAADVAPPVMFDRVRLTMVDGPSPLTGRLVGYDAESLRLAVENADPPESTARVIPRLAIASLEAGRMHGNAAKGAVVGAMTGLVVSFLLYATDVVEPGDEDTVFVLTILGLIPATATGAVIGNSTQSTRWEPAPLP